MPTDAIVLLEQLHCIKLLNTESRTEPYIWPALIRIDDNTIATPELVDLFAPVIGNARVVIKDSMRAGQTASIPSSVGILRARFDDNLMTRRLILVVALLENDETPRSAMEAGFRAFNSELRAAIARPETAPTFQVRDVAPDILLFANLGAVQLNNGFGIDQCRRVVAVAGADALILHFNALQEAVQPEGNTNFAGLLKKVEAVCQAFAAEGVPVIAKEVGWGFSKDDARRLADAGISAIDVAGAGGTSWSQVEMHRAENESDARVAAAFISWGIPTVDAILNVREAAPQLPVIASGGLRDGIDIAKCLALGATMGGMAGPFLKAANKSVEAVIETVDELAREIRIALFAAGCKDIPILQTASVLIEQH